jgi:hypothetical protein
VSFDSDAISLHHQCTSFTSLGATGITSTSKRGRIYDILWEWTARGLFIYSPFLTPPQAASPAMQLLLINVFDCFAISCFLYLLVVFRDHRRRRGLPYPPGPPSRPVIGNLLDFPNDMPWSAYAEMSKKYGMGVILGTLVLSSLNPHSKATLFVFAFFLRSSSSCVHYQPLRISSRSEGTSIQIGLPCQSRKCTSCSGLFSNQPPC